MKVKPLALTSNHDAKVSFGIEASQVNRKIIIQRHNVYLKIQDGRRRPYSKTCPTPGPIFLSKELL